MSVTIATSGSDRSMGPILSTRSGQGKKSRGFERILWLRRHVGMNAVGSDLRSAN
jgi:hypothetical protein